jgi:hypothetical protein
MDRIRICPRSAHPIPLFVVQYKIKRKYPPGMNALNHFAGDARSGNGKDLTRKNPL